jgi:sugar lactone lactonase YvrE
VPRRYARFLYTLIPLTLLAGCSEEGAVDQGADATSADSLDSVSVGDVSDTSVPDEVSEVEPAVESAGLIRVLVGDGDSGFVDGVGEEARFNGVTALCRGEGEIVYVADTFNMTIRRVDLVTREVTTLAGEAGRIGLADGRGKNARFTSPRGLACLGNGLLVADSGALRTVSQDGEVRTVAGFPGQVGDVDGEAIEARIGYLIHAMAVMPDGRIVLSDRSNDSVRMVNPETWAVTTLARDLSGPGGIAVDGASARVIVADTFADRLIRIDLDSGAVEPVVLSGVALDAPQGLAVEGNKAFVMGFGATVWEVDLDSGQGEVMSRNFGGSFASPVLVGRGLIYPELERGAMRRLDVDTREDTLIAGANMPFGNIDGDAATARFNLLTDMVADVDTLYVSDAMTGVKKVTRDGVVDTIAISGSGSFVRRPYGLARDEGHLYVSEPDAGRVWRAKLDGTEAVFAKDLAEPHGLAVNGEIVYVAERGRSRIVSWDGSLVVTVAGDGRRGSVDGPLETARFDEPTSLLFDAERRWLWVGELGTGRLRRVELEAGVVRTVIEGAAMQPYPDGAVGLAGVARLGLPTGLALTVDGMLVCDAGAPTLRRVVFSDGEATTLETVAGSPNREGGLPPGRDFPLEMAAFSECARGIELGGKYYVAAYAAIYEIELREGRSW